jgi:hypothetical protein
MKNAQLNLFDPPQTPVSAPVTPPTDRTSPGESYAPGVRVHIIQAGPPIEHLNGRLGEVVSVRQGLTSVQVEGIAAAMLLRVEAIERYSEITQYLDEEAPWIEVGSSVECDYAFNAKIGVVRRIEIYCGGMVAWVDFGSGKPLYPAGMESLSLA